MVIYHGPYAVFRKGLVKPVGAHVVRMALYLDLGLAVIHDVFVHVVQLVARGIGYFVESKSNSTKMSRGKGLRGMLVRADVVFDRRWRGRGTHRTETFGLEVYAAVHHAVAGIGNGRA